MIIVACFWSSFQPFAPCRTAPYSDAYLSGQPSKRRKLNAESKPPRGEVGRLLQQSLQEAVDQTGLQPAEGAAAVAEQVAANSAVQDSVEQMVRDTIQVDPYAQIMAT